MIKGGLKLGKSQQYAFADKLYKIFYSTDNAEQLVVTNGDWLLVAFGITRSKQ